MNTAITLTKSGSMKNSVPQISDFDGVARENMLEALSFNGSKYMSAPYPAEKLTNEQLEQQRVNHFVKRLANFVDYANLLFFEIRDKKGGGDGVGYVIDFPDDLKIFDESRMELARLLERGRFSHRMGEIQNVEDFNLSEMKDCCVRMVLSVFAKHGFRWGETYDESGVPSIKPDYESRRFTLGYYKHHKAQEYLSQYIKSGDTVADVFAGSGIGGAIMACHLNIECVYLSDLRYDSPFIENSEGRAVRPGREDLFRYRPDMNLVALQAVFDLLPHELAPNIFSKIGGFIEDDATKLDKVGSLDIDWVIGEVPFGKNCPVGCQELLKDAVVKGLEISNKGVIFLMPSEWIPKLKTDLGSLSVLIENVTPNLSKANKRAMNYVCIKNS